jgi:hypothetical protein
VYFAHGIGDFVMFGNVVPFIAHPTNKLYMTRVGDHFVGILDQCNALQPLYSGLSSVTSHTGAELGYPDFMIPQGLSLQVTAELKKNLEDIKCTHICVENFLEHRGNKHKPPFHSKPRELIHTFHDLLTPAQIASLNSPLPNVINTAPNPFVDALVDRRLRTFTPYNKDTKIVVITRYGDTSCEKNWGHKHRTREFPKEGDEARKFITTCRSKNKNTMEKAGVAGANTIVNHAHNVFSFGELFAPGKDTGLTIPYGTVLMSLLRRADVHIGCPTGPSGVASLFDNLQNVILWIDMFPSWFFEPTPNTINVLGNYNIAARKTRIGSFDSHGAITYNNVYAPNPHISPQVIFPLIEHKL